MSYKIEDLISVLSKLRKPAGPEGAMVTVVTGHPESFVPDLFQVINNFDGTYQVQQLEDAVDEEGEEFHKVAAYEVVDQKDIDRISRMCPRALSMNLSWGPNVLMTA